MLKAFNSPPLDDQVDPWHYTGDQTFHKSDPGQKFLEVAQKNLPKLTTTVKMGPTGYPAYGTSFKESWGWCLDEVGRLFVVTPHNYFFQRMLNGHLIMFSPRDRDSWMPTTSEMLTQIETDCSKC